MVFAVTPMHDALFEGRGAWRRDDFANPEAWTCRLSPAALDELDEAMRRARHSGRKIPTLTQADFPLPTFAPTLHAIRQDLESGRGFTLIRGLPIDRY